MVNVVLLRWSGCGNNRGAEVVGYGKSHGGLDDCPLQVEDESMILRDKSKMIG